MEATLKELITNFNEITGKESLDAFCGYRLAIAIITFSSIIIAVAVASSFYDTFKEYAFVKSIITSILTFVVAFFFVTMIFFIVGDNKVRENRLEEIVEVANKNNLSSELQITDNHIIYNDVACEHHLGDINDYVIKNDGNWIFIKD